MKLSNLLLFLTDPAFSLTHYSISASLAGFSTFLFRIWAVIHGLHDIFDLPWLYKAHSLRTSKGEAIWWWLLRSSSWLRSHESPKTTGLVQCRLGGRSHSLIFSLFTALL